MSNSILFMIHCEQYTGYAIEKLEDVFFASAMKAGFDEDKIHWSYSHVVNKSIRVHELDFHTQEPYSRLGEILTESNFDIVLAFDLPFPSKVVSIAKMYGVKKVISYWGASMSDLNSGLKLFLKKAEHWLYKRRSADIYIFESRAMELTATHGRGIPTNRTCVIPLGVDTNKYFPSKDKSYIHEQLNIPRNRKVVFYSGHMEERKGIRTIVRAARKLAESNSIENVHFVLCGNKKNQADTYIKEIKGSLAEKHVTFAGYRKDVPYLMSSSDIGLIASTGWDSFTMSSVEMLASGLPLIVSNLQGLNETIIAGKCGEYIQPGNFTELTEQILGYINNPDKCRLHSEFARQRAIDCFSKSTQVLSISNHLKHLFPL